MAGTSYTRQSTIADGNIITAALFNNEFNQILNAFAYIKAGQDPKLQKCYYTRAFEASTMYSKLGQEILETMLTCLPKGASLRDPGFPLCSKQLKKKSSANSFCEEQPVTKILPPDSTICVIKNEFPIFTKAFRFPAE